MECVGHADRSAFDLTRHTEATNVKLVAEKALAEPKIVQVRIFTTLARLFNHYVIISNSHMLTGGL